MNTNHSTQSLYRWLSYSHWFFIIGLLFWFGSLSLFNLGIDQELALFRTDQRIWLNQGRWVNFFISQYLYTQPVLYYFPHLLFIGCAAVSYALLLDSLSISIKQYKKALVVFPLFCAHPFWFFINEFYANIAPTALGLLCCSLSVWVYAKQPLRQTIYNALIQIVALTVAIGAYQAFLFVAFAGYTGWVLWQMPQLSIKASLRHFTFIALALTIAFVTHTGVQHLLVHYYKASPEYTHLFINLHRLRDDPTFILTSILKGIKNSYWGSAAVYTTSLFAYGMIMLVGMVSFIQRIPTTRRWFAIVVLFGWMISPFSLNFLSGQFAYTMPLRTFLAVPVIMVFLGLLCVTQLKNIKWSIVCLSLAVLGNIQILHAHARYNSAKTLLLQHDQQVAVLLTERIYQLIPDYHQQTQYVLDVMGGIAYSPPYGNVISSVTNASFFAWDAGNPARITAYLKTQGLPNLSPSLSEQRTALRPLYHDMPIWPAQGSVKVHEGIILVKFADNP